MHRSTFFLWSIVQWKLITFEKCLSWIQFVSCFCPEWRLQQTAETCRFCLGEGSINVELGGGEAEVSKCINCEGAGSLTCTTCQGTGIQPRYLDRREYKDDDWLIALCVTSKTQVCLRPFFHCLKSLVFVVVLNDIWNRLISYLVTVVEADVMWSTIRGCIWNSKMRL